MRDISKGFHGAMMLMVLAGLASSAYSGVIRDDRSDTLYLNLAAAPQFDGVGRIDFSIGSTNYLASGTLIAPDWVLTAAHVVGDATSLTFSVGGQSYAAAKWLAHPKWNNELLGGYDIGLMQLTDSVPDAVTPASLYTGSEELGATGTSVGFGRTGTGVTGAIAPAGTKRAGQNVIDAFFSRNPKKTPRIFLSDFDNPDDPTDNVYGLETPLDLEYLIAPGDSGGGVFIDFDGDGLGPLLAGVHSFGASFDEEMDFDYGDISGHTRVSVFNKWIDKAIAGGGGRGNKGGNGKGRGGRPSLYLVDQPLDMAGVVPEPATMLLLVVGGLAVLLRRRKRSL